MGSRVKVVDLEDVVAKNSPHLGYAKGYAKGYTVVHIIDRVGYKPGGSSLSSARQQMQITACNRATDWWSWSVYRKRTLPAKASKQWKLCQQCGSESDFRGALDRQVEAVALKNKERAKQLLLQKAERLALLSAMNVNLIRFEDKHITPDAPIVSRGETYIVFEAIDERFRITLQIEEV